MGPDGMVCMHSRYLCFCVSSSSPYILPLLSGIRCVYGEGEGVPFRPGLMGVCLERSTDLGKRVSYVVWFCNVLLRSRP